MTRPDPRLPAVRALNEADAAFWAYAQEVDEKFGDRPVIEDLPADVQAELDRRRHARDAAWEAVTSARTIHKRPRS